MLRYLPLLFLAACVATPVSKSAAEPALQADICAVLALPGAPGHEQTDNLDQRDRAWVINREVKDGWVGMPVEDNRRGATGPWGSCPGQSASGIDSIAFNAGRRYARTDGGWQAGPLAGGWGYCLYERLDDGWKFVACTVTVVS